MTHQGPRPSMVIWPCRKKSAGLINVCRIRIPAKTSSSNTSVFFIPPGQFDNVVGIATRYVLVGPGIKSRLGPWGPHSLLYYGYRFSFPGVKRPGRGVNHPTPSNAEVKERKEVYFYSTSWPVSRSNSTFTRPILLVQWYIRAKPLPLSSFDSTSCRRLRKKSLQSINTKQVHLPK
jgi:hypothetical protein